MHVFQPENKVVSIVICFKIYLNYYKSSLCNFFNISGVIKILTVTAIAITKAINPTIVNAIPRPLAKSGPTEDIFRQCGHRAKALFKVLN